MAERLTNVNIDIISAPLSSIQSETIGNGNIYFSHTGELFYDWENNRIQITDIVPVDTSTGYNSMSKVSGKCYFVKDITTLYYYDSGHSYPLTNLPTIEAHIQNQIVHVTAQERDTWNAKTTLDIDDSIGEVVNETVTFIR